MVNKICPVSCVADFKGKNKEFKKYIEKSNKATGKYLSFAEILKDANEKLK